MAKTINGVPFDIIIRTGQSWEVKFRKERATLADIEGIDWSRVTIEGNTRYGDVLPEGYGFKREDIRYADCEKCYTVRISLGKQYWGNVEALREDLAALEEKSAGQEMELAALKETAAGLREELAEADETIIALYEEQERMDEALIALYEQMTAALEPAPEIKPEPEFEPEPETESAGGESDE